MNGIAYEIMVGNIGLVYHGTNENEANETFHEYVGQSKSGYGRAAGETVTMFFGDDIVREHFGTIDQN